MKRLLPIAGAIVLLLPALAQAQVIVPEPRPIPQPVPVPQSFTVSDMNIEARVRNQVATVQVSQTFRNDGSAVVESVFLFPLPPDSAIDHLTLLVDGQELEGRLLPAQEARQIYESIVRATRDPALLEYMDYGVFQTSVFPVPAGAERRVILRYTQLCEQDSGLVSFLYPLGLARHSARPVDHVRLNVRVETTSALRTVYSPTHDVQIERPDDTHAVCTLELTDVSSPDDFRLLYGTHDGAVGMNVLSYRPDEGEDGYFLLLASPTVETSVVEPPGKTLIFVVDRSGSMEGEKFRQAQNALRFVLNNLSERDTFNIIAYDSTVEAFRPELQRVTDETRREALSWVDGLFAGGSTNIDGALTTAMGMLTSDERPSYVIFLTDGLPTTGETNETRITANATEANDVRARIFSFGVGFDVNARLLDRLVRENHGYATYVRPNEDIEVYVSQLYTRIGSPVMSDVAIRFEFDDASASGTGDSPVSVVNRAYPSTLPDLFQGDQIVWVGRYRHSGEALVTLSGSIGGLNETFRFPVELAEHSTDSTNSFIERLWAVRRISEILTQIDLEGQNQELIDELVRLATRHGILTPYTSFLADETGRGAPLAEANFGAIREQAELELRRLDQLAGADAVFQRADRNRQALAANAPAGANGAALAVDAVTGEAVEVHTIRYAADRTFYQRGNVLYDSTVNEEQEANAVVIEQFSDEYFELARENGELLARSQRPGEVLILNIGAQTYRIEPPRERS